MISAGAENITAEENASEGFGRPDSHARTDWLNAIATGSARILIS